MFPTQNFRIYQELAFLQGGNKWDDPEGHDECSESSYAVLLSERRYEADVHRPEGDLHCDARGCGGGLGTCSTIHAHLQTV